MRRVVSLYLPTWPTDRLRRQLGETAPPAETPVVMIGRQGQKRVILAANLAAQRLSLSVGMAAAQACALCSELAVHDADLKGDCDALDRLALWALKLYAPLVAADGADGLVIDASGATDRYGGEEAFLNDMVHRLHRGGVLARAAMADTWGAAHALARHGPKTIFVTPPDQIGLHIATLPVRALRLPGAIVEALGKVGVDLVIEVEAKPRGSLALRYGCELTQRLDQAYGRIAEPITPVEAPELISVRRAFPEPIGAPETLARYILKLVEALCTLLERKGLGARTLDLRFHRVDNRIEAIRIGAAKPVRDAKRLTRLLCDKLETVDPGFGVETMVLAAPITEPLHWRPTSNRLGEAATPDVTDLVDTLSNRLGPGRLYRMEPAQSDVPERSARRIKPTAPNSGESWPHRWPRPSRLLTRPEPIETVALLPDQPPVSFTWRGVRRRVKRADGPERIFGEWWRGGDERHAVRDYFQIEDEAGERFWVFRRGDGQNLQTGDLSWYLHGVFG